MYRFGTSLSSRSSPSRRLVVLKRWRSHSNSSNNNKFLQGKVLVANRGEIACRIMRTCQKLEIPTVAIYSSADGPNAKHVQMANEAYPIGTGPSPSESYLNQDEIIDLCQSIPNLEAIHPGYGFLSENASFSQAVTNAGLKFVGPPPEAISIMGCKSQSKQLMKEAGVSVIPGYEPTSSTSEETPTELLEKAITEVGFPLLIKAVAGGGGKGMRIVHHESDFVSALESCQREALASFGNRNVILERYLHHPRHVEVQIVADQHGNTVHLYERDCSLQRRHQKVIEEAPASYLPNDFRHELGQMACQAAQAVQYVNAGTVEFLVDGNPFSGGDNTNNLQAYFCEMNTRLQVEHGITELVIPGLDLVEWQLRIAAGETLPLGQDDIQPVGHAFEARLYAETLPDFLPSTGTIWHHEPPPKFNARTDTGLHHGQQQGEANDITVHYDPMISKLMTHGATRQEALAKLVTALQRYELAGTVSTNIDFLLQCAQHEEFATRPCHTGFLDLYLQDILQTCAESKQQQQTSPLFHAVATVCQLMHLEERINTTSSSDVPISWRMGGPRRLTVVTKHAEMECLCHWDGSYEIGVDTIDDDSTTWFQLQATISTTNNDGSGTMSIRVNDTQRLEYSFFRKATQMDQDSTAIFLWSQDPPSSHHDDLPKFGQVWFPDPVAIANAKSSNSGSSGSVQQGDGLVKAPMPGKVVQVRCKIGQTVAENDVLLVMEAMKMEHAIKAPCHGIVKELSVQVDQIIHDGHVVAIVEEQDEDDESTSINEDQKAV